MSNVNSVVLVDRIENLIYVVRGKRVMLDSDLATLYAVPTKALNQAVKRNAERFPNDFMFRLTAEEARALQASAVNRSQIVTGSQKHRDPRYRPYAFTEHGAIMAASVLNSPRAVQASVFVVRAFVRMREALSARKDFAEKLAELERKVETHDMAIREVVEAIKQLAAMPELPGGRTVPSKEGIGFLPKRT